MIICKNKDIFQLSQDLNCNIFSHTLCFAYLELAKIILSETSQSFLGKLSRPMIVFLKYKQTPSAMTIIANCGLKIPKWSTS